MYRVGQGYDIHRLAPGRRLVLGGVVVESDLGPEAHSDGDVLLHATASALLGAVGAGDLGLHFPDDDERFRGADSVVLLGEVMARVRREGWEVVNFDATVLAEAPKLTPQRSAMVERIAELLGVPPPRVNVKFGTGERVGPVGARQAIEATAVVLLARAETTA